MVPVSGNDTYKQWNSETARKGTGVKNVVNVESDFGFSYYSMKANSDSNGIYEC